MIRWGSVLTGFVVGAVLAWMRTSGNAGGASGQVAPTDQNKKAGWST